MDIRKFCSSLLFISVFSAAVFGQSKMSREDYIKNYKDFAIKEMLRSGVPASITLAQGMLESDNGNSSLARKANNHFGIKCHNDWTGPKIYHDDDQKHECFRKYKSAYESYVDHSDFLMSGSRYSSLFELDMTDYKGWARGLKKAGYATNPSYADKLIKIIEDNELHQFDLEGAGDAADRRTRKERENRSLPSGSGSDIMVRNRVKYIVIKPEDTFRSIQEKYDLLPFEIYKYNDMARDADLIPGQVIYLQPKRNKAEVGNNWHTVKPGETMLDISQKYAIKLSKLYSRNLLAPGSEIKEGDKISLRKKLKGEKPVVEKKSKAKQQEEEEDDQLRFEFDQ
ncbi:MAG: glucosaminidase domain-containing protein [Bacteroidales bacterium]|nr:glucosaminidase domain-containing protein [Bacteroidales bacterium]MCB9014052.1 glucosaminidase domain-containing protein [Bacteroidales bacterium]